MANRGNKLRDREADYAPLEVELDISPPSSQLRRAPIVYTQPHRGYRYRYV